MRLNIVRVDIKREDFYLFLFLKLCDKEHTMNKKNPNSSRVEFRPFTKKEWYAFGGSDFFYERDQPLKGTLKVDGYSAMALLDKNGISIFWNEGEEDFADCSGGSAIRAAALLRSKTTKKELEKLGFNLD